MFTYNVYLELTVGFWLVSSHPPFALCLNLHIPPTQQLAAYWQIGPQIAQVQLIDPSQYWLHSKTSLLKEMVAEIGSCSAPTPCGSLLGSPSADFVPTELTYM